MKISRKQLRAMLDLMVWTVNQSAGFLSSDDVEVVRGLAQRLGIDTKDVTPMDWRRDYFHKFDDRGTFPICLTCEGFLSWKCHVDDGTMEPLSMEKDGSKYITPPLEGNPRNGN